MVDNPAAACKPCSRLQVMHTIRCQVLTACLRLSYHLQFLGSTSFVSNTALRGFGGAVNLHSAGILAMANTSYTDNEAESGGAVYVNSRNGTLVLASGGVFASNRAVGDFTAAAELVRRRSVVHCYGYGGGTESSSRSNSNWAVV